MSKLDLRKEYKSYYTAKTKPHIVELEKANYISITGVGDPSGKMFGQKIQALYPVAYTIKFACKALDKDFVVAKLEGLWSFDLKKYRDVSINDAPQKIPRSEWLYRLLIRMPDYVSNDMLQEAVKTVKEKKGTPLIEQIEFYTLNEGKSVQIMHVGPFDTEPESLLKMKAFMNENGLQRNGEHHEIYLSDFRKMAPEKLKTILREPVK